MTLLEKTFRQLHEHGLVETAEHFSTEYLGRNRNWYAWQRHAGRDISAGAAISCLRTVRTQLSLRALASDQRRALAATAEQLLTYLKEHHFIADVCSEAD